MRTAAAANHAVWHYGDRLAGLAAFAKAGQFERSPEDDQEAADSLVLARESERIDNCPAHDLDALQLAILHGDTNDTVGRIERHIKEYRKANR